MTRSLAKTIALTTWISSLVVFFIFNNVKTTARIDNHDELVEATYDYRFGKNKPFAPGNADTVDGKFIPPAAFAASARCAKCHTDIHPQWSESAHANAFTEPFYQKNVTDLIAQKNIAFTRHCESCHNPAALFTGALTDEPSFEERPFDKEGVSCIVCHSIDSVNGRGIGGYVMGKPVLIKHEDGTGIEDATDEEITNDIDGHKRAMMREVLKKPEFCAACHKSQVPKELNDYKFMRAFMVGDEYQRSSFSQETPHSFYKREKETCSSCHMERLPSEFYDVSAKAGTVVSHRFAAANTAIPMAFGFKRQFEEVVGFLKDDKLAVDVFAVSRQSGGSTDAKLVAPLNRASHRFMGGDILTADVVITNKNVGHSFPPELRDFYEAFVEFEVKDGNGDTLFKSGYTDPNGFLEPGAHNYKTYLLYKDGKLNDLHHIWETRAVGLNRQIQSGRSDLARYRFIVPAGYRGVIAVSAKLRYRRFTKVFSDYVIGSSVNLPIVTMAETHEAFYVGTPTEPPGRPRVGTPDWQRWNNYGIALLDSRRFAESAEAFNQVAAFKNDYQATALTNKALSLIEMGDWKEAQKLVEKSLELESGNLRSLFQSGRIKRSFAKLEEAENEFLKVLESFPNDRLTLQQLGELAKLKSESVEASESVRFLGESIGYYERILKIDPEDLSAVYNLLLLYQKAGKREDARTMAEQFRELGEDTQTGYLVTDFLLKNPELQNESLPYHVHELRPFERIFETVNYPQITDIDWSKPLKTTADFKPQNQK